MKKLCRWLPLVMMVAVLVLRAHGAWADDDCPVCDPDPCPDCGGDGWRWFTIYMILKMALYGLMDALQIAPWSFAA